MARWWEIDIRSAAKRKLAPKAAYRPRKEAPPRDMVSGITAWCLYMATKDHAKAKGQALYITYELMGLGNSTSERMRNSKPIAQATALKILKYLGTDVRAVLSKYQPESK
ncbi:hypothetical protein ACN9MB_08960 [Dyella kyungheensis]|uniref:hypothetical protein n=1 Tax=Dyella kyungheensis TaxID=1242174 RepID=UPI003CF5BFF5